MLICVITSRRGSKEAEGRDKANTFKLKQIFIAEEKGTQTYTERSHVASPALPRFPAREKEARCACAVERPPAWTPGAGSALPSWSWSRLRSRPRLSSGSPLDWSGRGRGPKPGSAADVSGPRSELWAIRLMASASLGTGGRHR